MRGSAAGWVGISMLVVPLGLARQQFLRDGVAVVVREQVHAGDALGGQQRLAQVGLLGHRVAMAARLVGQAESEQVEREQRVAGRQRVPHRMPVVARSRITVDQEQRRPARRDRAPHEHRVPAERAALAGSNPALQIRRPLHRHP